MPIEMTYFADNAPNKLAENRSGLSTPDTSSVAKCSRLTTSGQMHSLTFELCFVFRIGPHKRASSDQPIARGKPTYQDLCDPTASDSFRFADNAEEIVG